MGKKNKRGKAEVKTYKGSMDDVLLAKNLWRKPMPKDGSCLFRAVSEQVCLELCTEFWSPDYHVGVNRCIVVKATTGKSGKSVLSILEPTETTSKRYNVL